jgi:hypothetical protein
MEPSLRHEGESSASVCDRLSRTRVSSQTQLPTDHDYAVPTREYQLDQSSPLPATAAADPVLEIRNRNHPTDVQILTGHFISTEGRGNTTGTHEIDLSSAQAAFTKTLFRPSALA